MMPASSSRRRRMIDAALMSTAERWRTGSPRQRGSAEWAAARARSASASVASALTSGIFAFATSRANRSRTSFCEKSRIGSFMNARSPSTPSTAAVS